MDSDYTGGVILSHSSFTKVGELLSVSDFSCIKSKKLIVREECDIWNTGRGALR